MKKILMTLAFALTTSAAAQASNCRVYYKLEPSAKKGNFKNCENLTLLGTVEINACNGANTASIVGTTRAVLPVIPVSQGFSYRADQGDGVFTVLFNLSNMTYSASKATSYEGDSRGHIRNVQTCEGTLRQL